VRKGRKRKFSFKMACLGEKGKEEEARKKRWCKPFPRHQILREEGKKKKKKGKNYEEGGGRRSNKILNFGI